MSANENGNQPAFPPATTIVCQHGDEHIPDNPKFEAGTGPAILRPTGITKRELIAALIMAGLCADGLNEVADTRLAVKITDTLLRVLA